MRHILILFISLVLGIPQLKGQTVPEDRLQVHLTYMEEDTLVRLRWAPLNMKSWDWGIENGFRLSRFTLGHNGVLDSFVDQFESLIILDSIILPLPENSWENLDATEDQIDLAKGALYEPSFVIDSMIGESDFSRAYADESDRESRFIFGLFAADQNFNIAKAMGFAFEDHDVDSTASYFYRIEFLGEVDSTILKNSGIDVDIQDDVSLPQLGPIQIEQAIDSNILLVWDVALVESYYTSYNIERSTDSVTFSQINDLPLIAGGPNGLGESLVYFPDVVPVIEEDYYYRAKGISPFGQEGPASSIVKVSTKPSPKASPPKISSLDIVSDDVNVDWEFPLLEETLISGFKVYRSQNALGPFELIDSVEADIRTWTDSDPITTGYYRITAMDIAGVEVRAGDKLIQLDDETPPPVPEIGNCSVSETGLVTVTWSPVSDGELRGYKVFAGSGEEGNYGEETSDPVMDTLFKFQVDIQTLTRDIYIKVKALDERENVSDFSEACHALLPDLVPPSKPVLLIANPLATGVQLEWIHSASEDLDRHIVQRKKKLESGWTSILEVSPTGTASNASGVSDVGTDTAGGKLLDTLVNYTWEYQYRVLAIDAAENKSASEILTVQPYDSGLRGEISELEADTVYSFTQSSISYYKVELTWEYEALDGLYNFQIYRSVDGKPMRAYKTTNGRGGVNFSEVAQSQGVEHVTPGSFSWSDNELGTGTIMQQSGYGAVPAGFSVRRTFKYQVMARHFDGGWSPVSDVVEIEVMVPK